MRMIRLIRFISLALSFSAATSLAAADQACKTTKGQSCVCAANKPKKCAHAAKAVCLSGKIVETNTHSLLTAHESNVELFKLCGELGGMKEIVFNNPILDTHNNAAND